MNYDAAGNGRRARGWSNNREAVNTILFRDADTLRARSRDAVRKNPWAGNAIDSFVANCIGVGIKPKSKHPDNAVKAAIHKAWARWTDEADAAGLTDFYGLQALACRAAVEGGESFGRMRTRRVSDGLSVPLQIQILEAEHLPTTNSPTSQPAKGNEVRYGIEFDGIGRRVAYHLYREHPGETIFGGGNYETTRILADEVAHIYRVLRPGQMRGEPWLTQVLVKLWELDQFDDATLVRQKVAALFAFFIKTDGSDTVLPIDESDGEIAISGMEPGTGQVLPNGKDVVFSDPPDTGNYEMFMRVQLRAVAAGLGITYEQLSGDLTGVNYSSIRAGLLEFRRRCEQFQYSVIVYQFCRPIFREWMRLAVLSGALSLPGYTTDPTQYEEVDWMPPGWPWVDPLKDVQAKKLEVRCGFSTRSNVVTATGEDPEQIDKENAQDNARADDLKLGYDSDAREALPGQGASIGDAAEPKVPSTPNSSPNSEPSGDSRSASSPALRKIDGRLDNLELMLTDTMLMLDEIRSMRNA